MKKRNFIFIIIFMFFCSLLTSCSRINVKNAIASIEKDFPADLPDEYKCIYSTGAVYIDGKNVYLVLEVSENFKLEYDEQFYTEYSNYDSFNVFDRIADAKEENKSYIKESDSKFFVTELEDYDWQAYEKDPRKDPHRYYDLYLVHDKKDNKLYVYYDVHQWPYNNQNHPV